MAKLTIFMSTVFILFGKTFEKLARIVNILIATQPNVEPFFKELMGSNCFSDLNCAYQNCYMTDDRSYLGDVTAFDVVVFNSINLFREFAKVEKPSPVADRSRKQKYVLFSKEPSARFPLTTDYNGFFNWTWTYRFNSDLNCPYIIVKDKFGRIIGPRAGVDWIEEMKPVGPEVTKRLISKKKAAAWFVSHCNTENNRSDYAYKLNKELNVYGYAVDIFGDCGTKKCPKEKMEECGALIESDYYFYLAFENSFSEDYVSEKILMGLKNYAVPVVLGGADYSRFMPHGMYLNAVGSTPKHLAKMIVHIMSKSENYERFFRYHNYYSYHDPSESPETHVLCKICEFVNDEANLARKSEYPDIIKWFNEKKDWYGLVGEFDTTTTFIEPTIPFPELKIGNIGEFFSAIATFYNNIWNET